MRRAPLYVIFEGIDGAGKDTQADLLAQRLEALGQDPLRINEPDDSPDASIALLLRQELREGRYSDAHAALFLAERMALQQTKVVPALEAGRPVISARSFLSTLVYQQEQWPLDWLISLHTQLRAKPTHLIVLDIDVERAGKRRIDLGEVYERNPIQFRNRGRYQNLCTDPKLEPLLAPGCHRTVMATGSDKPAAIHKQVCAFVGIEAG